MNRRLQNICLYFFLTLGALFMVFPFIWMFLCAFKTHSEITAFPPSFFPKQVNADNFETAFSLAPFGKYFFNSIVVMIASVICTTFTSITGAFAFARLKFPGRGVLLGILVAFMMVPFEMLIITNYGTIVRMGLYNTLPALVLPFVSSIFYMYILESFFSTVPDGLYYAARIDGATNWFYLWRVLVPLARPSLVTIVLLNALASWNSFMWPLYITSDETSRTLPYGLQVFTTEAGSKPELLMAASTIIVLPMIVLFLFCRKYIVNGVARGGMKG